MARNGVSAIWQVSDSGVLRIAAARLLRAPTGRHAGAVEARLGAQFLDMNTKLLAGYGIDAQLASMRDGRPELLFHAGSTIGAIPLRSPVSGDIEHGLIVRPRFGWLGVGAMLSGVGARVQLELPKLPTLPKSELGVPAWVIASIVLFRLERLLSLSLRHFQELHEIVDRPRGRIDWSSYIARHLARAQPSRVPCSYPALQADEALMGAVHATALKQLQSLSVVRRDTVVARRLMTRYESLRQAVASTRPRWSALGADRTTAPQGSTVEEAIEAMRWTFDDRGLAGLRPMAGLAWRLPMDEVFEAWIEVVVRSMARMVGGVVRTGRGRETLRPLAWSPPYAGSQRYLLPDVELVRDDETIIFDAKYKSHWEEIDERSWHSVSDTTRESHRADLLQVLAYAAASESRKVTCVLVYPCRETTWASLRERKRHAHVAEIPAGARSIKLILAAVPLAGSVESLARALAEATGDR